MRLSSTAILIAGIAARLVLVAGVSAQDQTPLPWRQAGLTERQAAYHLSSRLGYGPRPGEIDEMLRLGLENWLSGQLLGDLPDATLTAKLAHLASRDLSDDDLARLYGPEQRVLEEAIRKGAVDERAYSGDEGPLLQQRANEALMHYAERQGLRPTREALVELLAEKLLRGRYSDSQLQETLVDFWFNHFNVSFEASRELVPHFERTALRPRALGHFADLLVAVAEHPAMLRYLGNDLSVAGPEVTTTFDLAMESLGSLSPAADATRLAAIARHIAWRPPELRVGRSRNLGALSGLNENYARELLELHTLGVDGGYTQRDVIELARVLTGWTILPLGPYGSSLLEVLEHDPATSAAAGFYRAGLFLFRPDWHDAEPKSLLGAELPGGGGREEGLEVLSMLANHPSTRLHLSHELALRYVSDLPGADLLSRLVRGWELSGGDVREVMRALVYAPEFWQSYRFKVKTPLELVLSALRGVAAEIDDPAALDVWLGRMGQRPYRFAPPTGYPDYANPWLAPGPMLARMQFARQLSSNNIEGVRVDLPRLVPRGSLASLRQAVRAYGELLLPEAEVEAVIASLFDPATDEAGSDAPPTPAGDSDTPPTTDELRNARRAVVLLLASPQFQYR